MLNDRGARRYAFRIIGEKKQLSLSAVPSSTTDLSPAMLMRAEAERRDWMTRVGDAIKAISLQN